MHGPIAFQNKRQFKALQLLSAICHCSNSSDRLFHQPILSSVTHGTEMLHKIISFSTSSTQTQAAVTLVPEV